MTANAAEIWRPKNPLITYFGAALLLFVLRCSLAFIALPPAAAFAATFLTTAIFIIVPFVGLFAGAAHGWKTAQAWILLLSGVILHAGALLILTQTKMKGIEGVLLGNVMQLGMLGWTLALGVLVSILIKERNMLLPVAIFLAGLDALLILTPFTPQAKIAAQAPEIIGNMGLRVPAVRSTETGISNLPIEVRDIGFVGPADLFISAMFFAAIFRYGMRSKETAIRLPPVLIAYLFLVFLTGMPLPALVPIGITFLIINWREFKLSKDEKIATWVIAFIAMAMAGYGLYAKLTHKPQATPTETSHSDPAPKPPTPVNSTEPPDPTNNR